MTAAAALENKQADIWEHQKILKEKSAGDTSIQADARQLYVYHEGTAGKLEIIGRLCSLSLQFSGPVTN